MTTEVILTGTGYPRPHPDRAGPGVLIKKDNTLLQFDAGRGTSMRLAALDVHCREITALFITHHHSDHISGLADLVLSRWTIFHDSLPESPLTVIAPIGPAADFAEDLLSVWQSDISVRQEQTGRSSAPAVESIPFEATTEPSIVWEQDNIRVLTISVHHEPVLPSVAYRIETEDGAVVISGDTRVCAEVARLSQGADVLVHEAMRKRELSNTRLAGITSYHADSVEVGALAASLAVPVLMLTHLIPAPETNRHEQVYVEDIRAGGYKGKIIVGKDLDRVTMPLE